MIKSTIKGAKLHSSGDLNLMLRYNATQMFIQSFNNIIEVSDIHFTINSELLWKAMQYNNTTAFKHLCFNTTRMVLDQPPIDFDLSSALIKHGNIEIFNLYMMATNIGQRPDQHTHAHGHWQRREGSCKCCYITIPTGSAVVASVSAFSD
ncbi:hypothetical protein SAMD00019534_023400 [Acytostelium subglobosum LB1]|uniref:hypothetical protein n=1 Tax=Acytostelium subglobosum LB1 TaxID=1410327 RepID=UPI00064482A2|nr:hypothetical protein SAMD00019534_023400 [Acytostelium subglobosum LB1]GAM19165.1 hypothetical protein SAMD00019534_023400 [Acytostelium subglobosum LB1]|eukprot:XP_012757092.1 hypothetical protein SAMD00019534_023400 [Acytostelium subglobosum LB1]